MVGAALALVLTLQLPPLAAPQDKTDADLKALQGTWQGWVVEGKGKKIDAGFVHVELIIKKDTIVARGLGGMKEGPLGEGTFKLSLSGPFKLMDATRTSMPSKGKTYLGIYEIDGDTLKWCVANPNQDRPEELLTRRGQFLMILKRK